MVYDAPPRPSTFPYAFRSLLDFPSRLLNPPHPPVGRVRSFRLTPVFKVTLDDVLNARHLPPLGLKEFEDYLLFTERSVENLYFHMWLRNYERKYNAYLKSPTYPSHNAQLALSYARCQQTFFVRGGPYQLNLDGDALERLQEHTPRSHPPPEAFAKVKYQVDGMLNESLNRFVAANCGNSGRARGIFALFVGLLFMAVGLAPVLISIFREGKSRWLRLASFPPFWLGAATIIAGLHGVCVVIFMFGDARQLHSWELARPAISEPRSGKPLLPQSLTPDSKQANAAETIVLPTLPSPSQPPLQRATDLMGYYARPEDEESQAVTVSPSFSDDKMPNSPNSASALVTALDQQAICPFAFDFDSLPPPPESSRVSSGMRSRTNSIGRSSESDRRTVFAPLTKVCEPIIKRAQWEIVMRSAFIAAIISAALSFGLLAVEKK